MSGSLGRRELLGSVVAGLFVGGIGGRSVTAPPRSPHRDGRGEPVPDDRATPVAEEETPYAVYQYRPGIGGGFVPTLPVNVVFPLETAVLSDVVGVLQQATWYERPAEYPRYAYDRDAASWCRSDWSGAEMVTGAAGRLHVRCWGLAGTASLQVHVDSPPSPHHRIRSHSAGRRAVERLFSATGWTVAGNPVDLGNDQPPDHDGTASVITR